MLEHHGLCGDGTYTTWAEKLYESDEQVDGKDEEFAHETNDTMPAVVGQTAQHRRLASYDEFATHRFQRPLAGQKKRDLSDCTGAIGDDLE